VRTYGGRDVVVRRVGGDEADEEAALADGRVPDEQDLEGAVVAARRRRGHASDLGSATRRRVVGWCGRWPGPAERNGNKATGRGRIGGWKPKRNGGGERRGGAVVYSAFSVTGDGRRHGRAAT
jgi:hypothetical protein